MAPKKFAKPFAKIFSTARTSSSSSPTIPAPTIYSEEEIRAATNEAHSANRAVAVHVLGGQAARNVIMGGADSIEHGWTLDDDLLRLMKEKGVFLAGTDFPAIHLKAAGYHNADKIGANIIDRLTRAYKIGVKLTFSTDTVTEMPNETRADMAWDYLAVWRAAGVPPNEILKAMTTNAAELLRIQKERGAISHRPLRGHHRHALEPSRRHRVHAQNKFRNEKWRSHKKRRTQKPKIILLFSSTGIPACAHVMPRHDSRCLAPARPRSFAFVLSSVGARHVADPGWVSGAVPDRPDCRAFHLGNTD